MLCVVHTVFFLLGRLPLGPTLFPYTTLFRSRFQTFAARRSCAKSAIDSSSPRLCEPAVVCTMKGSPVLFRIGLRSEEHTSELQSRFDLVCRLLLEKKKNSPIGYTTEETLAIG